jgi:type II secretory pathway predicted ATPase ExeA
MYEAYWGLQERPFQNAPDPKFLFYAESHEEALVRLLYAVSENKGLALLTGQVGTGKTLLCRVFRKELTSRGYEVAVLVNPDLSPEELLRAILAELGAPIPTSGGKPELWDALARYVTRGAKGGAREIVLVVDEAQSIADPRSFETLRMLLNIVDDDSGRFCFTLVLAGQPELRERVQQSDALCQRVAVACELRRLTREETAEYLAHRLRTAGAGGELFTDDAIDAVHAATEGVPRAINTLADLALLTGSSRQADRVDAACVEAAGSEILQPSGRSA